MARSRKEDDKCPWWSWVPNCSPFDVTNDNVKTAYRINIARCENKSHNRNCRGNPFCLSKLGEDKWSKNQKDFNNDQFDDPEKERRKPGTYVGLKNLGATCYVNSLLQLWFHNLNFRKAIFMWDPDQDPVADPDEQHNSSVQEEKLVLRNLQAVFALMQCGNKRYVDPTDFITSLRLDISVQQDAQEFSKLFLSKLESVLSYQSQKEVRDLIKDNFCGEYLYVTRCTKCQMESKCPSKFYELNLNVKGNKTIQDCLKEFMKKEILEGDNKYSCAVCREKQDAERFISVTELPPVLNLQLMRFYYDINTDQKRKLNTAIQFTEKLNMSELCPDAKGGLEYTLSAVLYHGGNSANSGHYVAHICDNESGTWYKFNDESVEKIDNKKLKFTIEDEYEDAKKNKGQRALPKGWYQSKSAYMLVYTRSDALESVQQEKTADSDDLKLPVHLEKFVSDQNELFESWVAQTKLSNDASVGRSLSQQEEMISCILMMPVDSDSEDFDAVPTSWLQQWLLKPEIDCEIDNRKFTCQHGKLDPNEVPNVKYINSDIVESLFDRYRGGPRLKYCEFKCKKCVMSKCFEMRMKSRISEEKKFIAQKLKNTKEMETGFWVGKSSIRNWHNLAQKNLDNGILNDNCLELLNDVSIDNKTCLKQEPCEKDVKNEKYSNSVQNGLGNVNLNKECKSADGETLCVPMEDDKFESVNVTPVEAKSEPVVSSSFTLAFQNFLKAQDQATRVPSSTDSDEMSVNETNDDYDVQSNNVVMNECHPEKNGSSLVSSTTTDEIGHFNNVSPLAVNNNSVEVNGKNEFRNYCKSVKRKRDDDDDSSNAEIRFNEDLLCQHGNLSIEENKRRLVPEEAWRIFKKYFPFAKEFTIHTQACSLCKSIASEDEVAKDMYKTEAMNQKERLLELYLDRNRPQLKSDKVESGSVFYIINKEFISSWRKFIREAGKKEPPYSIKNQVALLCSNHGGLLYDLSIGVPDTIVLATSGEWERLAALYTPDSEISVKCLENGKIETVPEVCIPCTNNRIEAELKAKLCYTNAKIYIKLLNEDREEPQISNSTNSIEESIPAKRAKLNQCNNNNNCSNSTSNNIDDNMCNSNDNNNNNNCTNGTGDVCNDISSTSNHNQYYNDSCNSKIISNCNSNCNSNDVNVVSIYYCKNIENDIEIDTTNRTSCEKDVSTTNNATSSSTVNDANNNNEENESLDSEFSHKVNNGNVNGKSSPSHSSVCSNNVNTNGMAMEPVAVRRSTRPRRGGKTVEIVVSSDLTLKDVKKKIYEKMEVVTLDQHLLTVEGVELSKDHMTLADLSILPGTMLHLKVDEPPRELSPEWQESTTSREVERGFSGTVLA